MSTIQPPVSAPSLKAFQIAADSGDHVQAQGSRVTPAPTGLFGKVVNWIADRFSTSHQQINKDTRTAFHAALTGKFGADVATRVFGNAAQSTRTLSSREIKNVSKAGHQQAQIDALRNLAGDVKNHLDESTAKINGSVHWAARRAGGDTNVAVIRHQGGITMGYMSDPHLAILKKVEDCRTDLTKAHAAINREIRKIQQGANPHHTPVLALTAQLQTAVQALKTACQAVQAHHDQIESRD